MPVQFAKIKTILITLLLVGSVLIPRIPHLLGDTLFVTGTICIFGLWLTQMILAKKITTKLTPFNRVLFAGGITALISLVISPHFLESFYAYLKLTSLIMLAFIILNHEEPKKLVHSLTRAVIGTSVLLSLAAFAEYYFGLWGTPAGGRVMASFPNPNHLAGYLAAGITLLFSSIQEGNHSLRKKILLSIMFTLIVGALLLTGSKGGFLSAWFGIAILLFWGKKKRVYVYLAVSAVIVVTVLFSPLKGVVLKRELADPFTFEKTALFKETAAYISDYPLLGTGLEMFKYYYPQYKSMPGLRSAPYVHNEFLNIWTDMGFFGFAAYCWFLVIYIFAARTLVHKSAGGIVIGFIAVSAGLLLHSMVEFNLHVPVLAVLLIIGAALSGNLSKEQEGKKLEIGPLSPQVGIPVVWAMILCIAVLLIFPLVAQNYAEQGEDAYKNMNYVEAINAYSKAVKYNPLSPEILEQTAKAFYKEGTLLHDEIFLWAAQHYMEKAVRLEPRNLFRRRSLAALYERQGKINEAKQAYADVLTLAPNVELFKNEFDSIDKK